MAVEAKVAKMGGPAEKTSGATVMRAAGERSRQRLTGGSCTESSVLKIKISCHPWQKLKDPRYPEEEITAAACIIARCWLEVGKLSDEMKAFKKQAGMLRKKAEILMRTYGLDEKEVMKGK